MDQTQTKTRATKYDHVCTKKTLILQLRRSRRF